jgi:nitrate/nitrite transport system substrate-binding protein
VAQKNQPVRTTKINRRDFLKISGGAVGLLLAGMPKGWVGGVYAADAPETTKVRFGIIALTDCSSIVMAHELGLFKKYGIESTISKEASWAVIRDRITLGENQATHMLFGMPFASTMGLLGSPKKPMVIPFVLNRNGQAITLDKELLAKGVRTPQALKPVVDQAKKAGTPMTFAMTFPPGTHAMWTRYWLGSGGIHPDKDVTLITIPPPQMVANMKVGNMDAFCVGEPWPNQLVNQDIGYTACTTGEIWSKHPEKALGMRAAWVDKNPNATKALLMAVMEAQQWCEKMENKEEMSAIVGKRQWFYVPVADIVGRA